MQTVIMVMSSTLLPLKARFLLVDCDMITYIHGNSQDLGYSQTSCHHQKHASWSCHHHGHVIIMVMSSTWSWLCPGKCQGGTSDVFTGDCLALSLKYDLNLDTGLSQINLNHDTLLDWILLARQALEYLTQGHVSLLHQPFFKIAKGKTLFRRLNFFSSKEFH